VPVGLTSYEVHTILVAIAKTAVIAVLANVLAMPLGIACGMARMARYRVIRFVTGLYIEIFRGTSALVQLFYAYYVLKAAGVSLSPFMAGTLVLALNGGAYAAETARGALLAVPPGQQEAAAALNLGWWTTRFAIVLPQAWPIMVPSFGNLAIDLLKATSLLSLVAVPEVTATLTNLSTAGALHTDTAYWGLLLVYLALSIPLAVLFHLLERRARRATVQVAR
jgi:polar amino acid transport system permease protein